ncbi:MAG: hypothetical protein DRN53_05280 [Thermoprotei archaeon]|nr:MAG: hypothetical protein DRN53_05280 [Thermoprotei archaeon]
MIGTATMRNARILGSIGGVLLLLSPIPYVGITLRIAGLVLVLIAVKYISDVVKDPRIFDSVIIAIGAGISGTVIYFSIVIPSMIGSLSLIVMIALIVEWVVFIISGVFARRSCNRIAELTGVNMFKTVGLLLLIGSVFTIVTIVPAVGPVVGSLITGVFFIIAEVLGVLSFISLPETYPPPSSQA